MGRRASFLRSVAWLALACAASGCAVLERRNRRVLSWLDDHAIPENPAARVSISPVALPVSLTALAGDAALVHPVCSIDDAYFDTGDAIWSGEAESRFRKVVVFPLRVVATPVFFTGAVIVRSLFDIEPNQELDP